MFDSFELNKVAGAVLFSLLVMMGIGIMSEMVFHVEAPEQPGYVIEVAEQEAAGAEEEEAVPLAQLLAQADAGRGEDAARKCLACHTFEEGGANKVGPNLYGVVGAEHAHLDDFSYSDALQEQEGPWSYERLDAFLASPRQAIPGTAMAFAGIRDEEERADVIVYLKSLSPDAPPLPEPEAAGEPQEDQEGQEEQDAQDGDGDDGDDGAAAQDGQGEEPAGQDSQQESGGNGNGGGQPTSSQ